LGLDCDGTAGAAERARINGKILGADGKPMEHATVLVYEARVRNGYSAYCPTRWVDCGKRTITNAEGEYSIPGLNSDLVFKLLVVQSCALQWQANSTRHAHDSFF
jgi:protocatechuate 3,4-dioxygenase beta subunit